jgi:hypothetical protein
MIKLVAGFFIILIGFPIFIGGSAILLITPIFADDDGYFMSQTFSIDQDGVAAIRFNIPLEDVHIGVRVNPSDFVTLKVNVNQQNDSNAFLGLATHSEANSFLESVSYLEIIDLNIFSEFDFGEDDFEPEISWTIHQNTTAWAVPEKNETTWLAGGELGSTFTWEPTISDLSSGPLSLIIMNSDLGAANNVSVSFSVGAHIPIINAIGWMLTVFGGLFTLLGIIIVWSGFRSKPRRYHRTRHYQGAVVTRVDPIERAPPKYQLRCTNCGSINEPDSSFCSQCGEILLSEDRTSIDTAIKDEKLDTIESTTSNLVVADWGPRFWAFVIDLFIVGAITSALSSMFFLAVGDWTGWSYGLFSPFQWLVSLGPSSIVFFVYSIAMEHYYGQTLGKMALDLEVVSEQDGVRPLPQDLVINSIGKAFFWPIDLIIGRIIRDESQVPDLNQRLTQKWSKVVVIQKSRRKDKTTHFVSSRI